MSLDKDREPVEVRMWLKGKFVWVKVKRYVVRRGRSKGWLTYLYLGRCEYLAAPENWQKVTK